MTCPVGCVMGYFPGAAAAAKGDAGVWLERRGWRVEWGVPEGGVTY
jgi:hypothetical protein